MLTSACIRTREVKTVYLAQHDTKNLRQPCMDPSKESILGPIDLTIVIPCHVLGFLRLKNNIAMS